MPSGQTIINNALTVLGVNELGGTPSASDSTDCLGELNRMWSGWAIDEGLIYAVKSIQAALTATIGTYTIGPGATINQPAPARIYKAVFVTSAAGRIPLRIIDQDEYYSHTDLTASALAPDNLYPDFNIDPGTGYATLRLYPVQNVAGSSLELEIAVPFIAWILAGVYMLPAGYEDAITQALAWRLIPRYSMIVPAELAQVIQEVGQKAELRIREANKMNRKLVPGTEALTPPQAPAARA